MRTSPERMARVATLVLTTEGILNSRATMELCDNIEPMSVTTADAMRKSGVHDASVKDVTRI